MVEHVKTTKIYVEDEYVRAVRGGRICESCR